MKLNSFVVVAGLAVVSAATSAHAFVPWTNSNGSNSVISWTNGGSANGLFGSPTVVADTFFFIANSNFDAQASNGGQQVTTDTLTVTVHAQPGNFFTEVLFHSSGDYTVFGSGASVDVAGNMYIEEFGNPTRNANSPFVTNPIFPQVGNDDGFNQGSWSGQSLIDFASFGLPPVTAINLTFTNSLIAISVPGATAAIATLPNTQGSFSLQLVPAPGTMALGLMGLGLVGRRRR
jgi:uncharacterized protein (TIGR03382 family)